MTNARKPYHDPRFPRPKDLERLWVLRHMRRLPRRSLFRMIMLALRLQS
jgi:hypothetical protein